MFGKLRASTATRTAPPGGAPSAKPAFPSRPAEEPAGAERETGQGAEKSRLKAADEKLEKY